MNWKVVPICEAQKRDVSPEDLLNGGIFRKCDTYKGGGGYDQFPAICEKRLGKRLHKQFVVQLYGCPLNCWYCYVTKQGIWGTYKEYTTRELAKAFVDSKQEVFHLMGGAPDIFLSKWNDIISILPFDSVFHSDFLLLGTQYTAENLRAIAKSNCLYAANIKGVTREDYHRNTGIPISMSEIERNLEHLMAAKVNFYLTFTNPNMNYYDEYATRLISLFGEKIMADSFIIPIIEYKAIQPTKEDVQFAEEIQDFREQVLNSTKIKGM